tara:strand:- start:102 stop:1562 length:1461 start_codon:yes stop_codon:yes gene_type:complete
MDRKQKLDSLFNPKGVVVVGASSHPGKFGFVALHNILNGGFSGPVYATNKEKVSLLGIETIQGLREIPPNTVDFAMVCVPSHLVPETLLGAANIGIKAAFIVSGGYGEIGAEGAIAEQELLHLAADLDIAIAGPNGQGFVSTPINLCSQIVAPNPPAGTIAIASQSGNLLSAFMNLSRQYNIGISRGISTGNQTCLDTSDYIDYFANDDETSVIVSYVEGVSDGRRFYEAIKNASAVKPVIVIRGGSSPEGAKAASSHTGALATDEKVFEGMLKQAGAFLADDPLMAYEWASTFATQPKPSGPNTVVLTQAGGWGVLTADAISKASLNLIDLPNDLISKIDTVLPPRWSRGNPIDIAGGETRETIPKMIELVLSHESVDALIFLGLGIQGNIARLFTESDYLDPSMERIINFHKTQEKAYVDSLIKGSKEWGKPVLVATELGCADPNNPAISELRREKWFCHYSGSSAVRALENLNAYARNKVPYQ